MSTSEFIVISGLSGAAILLWAMVVWGGWAERVYERHKGSRWPWFWLRIAGAEPSRKSCVRFLKAVSFLGMVLVSIGVLAAAQTVQPANPLLGTWEQSRPNGTKMVWEFSAATIAFTLIGPSGEQAEPRNTTSASYEKLGRSELGDSYRIALTDTNGEPTVDIMVLIKDQDSMRLDFPGYGPFELIRVRP